MSVDDCLGNDGSLEALLSITMSTASVDDIYISQLERRYAPSELAQAVVFRKRLIETHWAWPPDDLRMR